MLIDSNDWRVFTGNEMGCLLIWWMIHVYKSKAEGPGKMQFSVGHVCRVSACVVCISELYLLCRHNWFFSMFVPVHV